MRKLITCASDIDADWLTDVLSMNVVRFELSNEAFKWSNQIPIIAHLTDGRDLSLRVKICSGEKFGRSEVDYYKRDYVGLDPAPLVKCWDAVYEASVGYHILLDDLSLTHANRRDVLPTLNYGMAVAMSLARLHRHHWETKAPPSESKVDRYFEEVRPGIKKMEQLTGFGISDMFVEMEQKVRSRLRCGSGMSLIHGDLNSMNILTPKGADCPVYFLDRQPFDWSLTYTVAVYDLAYFLVLWWPAEVRAAHEAEVLQCWYETLDQPSYSWKDAVDDWKLAVSQCVMVPVEWCSKIDTANDMRWLWEVQLARVQSAISSSTSIASS
jgi:hypothetical protein